MQSWGHNYEHHRGHYEMRLSERAETLRLIKRNFPKCWKRFRDCLVTPEKPSLYNGCTLKQKSTFQLSIARHLIWCDELSEMVKRERNRIGTQEALKKVQVDERNETVDPRFIIWSIWMNQVWIAYDGFRERDIEIPGLGLTSQDKKALKKYRDVSKHMRSRLDDKDFTRPWEDPNLPMRVKKACDRMMQWVATQPEWRAT